MRRFSLSTKLLTLLLGFNLLLFAVIFVLPPELYSKIMNEPDYSFLNIESLVFILSCDLAFYLGYILYSPLVTKHSRYNLGSAVVSNTFIVLPLVPFMFLTAVSVVEIIKAYPQLLYVLGSPSAQQVRADVGTQQNVMSGAPIILTGMIWWAIFRMRCSEIILQKKMRSVRVVIVISVVLVAISFIIRMSRMQLLPLIIGLLINYKYAEYVTLRQSRTNLSRSIVVIIVGGLLIFITLSLIRGYNNWQDIAQQIFAYGPASYNRLSAILSGRLHFYGQETGIYVSSFQGQIPLLKHFINVYHLLGQPSLNTAWLRTFNDVGNAGLNADYTFPTVYGAIYSFFGIWSPIYFFGFGIFFKQIVHSINSEKIFGIVYFPFIIFSLLFLFGWNFMLSYNFIVLLITVFILFLYKASFRSIFASKRLLKNSVV